MVNSFSTYWPIGLIAALMICGAAYLLREYARNKKSEQIAKQQLFYRECRSFSIVDSKDLNIPEKRQQIGEIARRHHFFYSSTEELGHILDTEKLSYETRQRSKA